MNVQVKVPFAWVVMAPWVHVMAAASKEIVVVELPAKPVPVAVRVLPTGPLEADSARLGFTVKEAAAEFDEPSVPVTVWTP